jgi:hypothetical protein
MNAFKKKVLVSAVLAGMSAAGAAHAVYDDPNGRGQVLIYPYYTVQAGHNTYISVVNTESSSVKVVKVRFREGRNSREVLDFNLYLSPSDVWAGAIIPADSAVATSGGRLITTDVSCTNPAIPSTGVDFRNYLYSGTNDDGAGTGLDRTREGYVEMIEMGVLNPATAPGNAAVHGASGSPTCTGLTGQVVATVAAAILAPSGGLTGTGTLINVADGKDMGYNAEALSNLTAAAIYFDIGNDTPNFANADPTSIVTSGNRVYLNTFAATPLGRNNAVSSVIDHSTVINEYILDTATKSNTDWVVTFPTKSAYVTTAGATAPFTNKFTASGACEAISFTFFNREERGATAAGGDFSPLPPGAAPSSLCWESTVVSIRNGAAHVPTGSTSGVFGSVNTTPVTVTTGFQNGWAVMSFVGTNATAVGLSAAASTTINLATGAADATAARCIGLPAVGFMARSLNTGTLGSFQANYGSSFGHKYIQNISPTP